MSNPKETEAEAFKKWFYSQKTYNSLASMERALNITDGYLHSIRDGKRRATDPQLRRKLKEATELKVFDSLAIESKTLNSKATSSKEIQTASKTGAQGVKELPEELPTLLESAINKLGLTLRECSQKYRISLNSLKKYKSGIRKPASENNISAIFRILNDAELITSKEDLSTVARVHEMPSVSISTTAERKARAVMRLLISLSNELEFFKNCTEDERRIFKKAVPGQDVGYITTLLRALYDEDKFQKWLFFSTYTMKGKDSGE
jgi:hypothetical protein